MEAHLPAGDELAVVGRRDSHLSQHGAAADVQRLCYGAKLTGAGGGGAIIALAPEEPERIAAAFRSARYRAFTMQLGGGK